MFRVYGMMLKSTEKFKLHYLVKIVVNNGKVKPPFNLCLIICMLQC